MESSYGEEEEATLAQIEKERAEIEQLEAEISHARQQLANVRRKRQRWEQLEHQRGLLEHQQSLVGQNEDEIVTHAMILRQISASRRLNTAQERVNLLSHWHTLSQVFSISHRGPFVTINGLRLGYEAIATSFGASEPEKKPQGLFFAQTKPPSPDVVRVPWIEINAALGYVTFLMIVYQERMQKLFPKLYRHTFSYHGSCSRVIVSKTTLPLYYEEGFSLFNRKRPFNQALIALLECVSDAAANFQRLDRSVFLPHDIAGETVGGFSIQLQDNGQDWTKAMKYLLTDIKHLMTFRHLDHWQH